MRGQVSLEAFFAFTLFFLLLGWLANYAGGFHASVSSSAILQEQVVAKDLAVLANRACVTNASITYSMPCIFRTNASAFYGVNSSGNTLNVVAPDLNMTWSVETLCGLNTSFMSETMPGPTFGQLKVVACDPADENPALICIKRQNNLVTFLRGECV